MCSGEEDVAHILLDCKDSKHWRLKLIRDKWLNMNKEVGKCRKIMKTTNKTHIQNLGKYLDIVKNKWLKEIKNVTL